MYTKFGEFTLNYIDWIGVHFSRVPSFSLFQILSVAVGFEYSHKMKTSGSAIAEGPRDVLVSRNSATTKHPIWKLEFQVYCVTLFVWSYV